MKKIILLLCVFYSSQVFAEISADDVKSKMASFFNITGDEALGFDLSEGISRSPHAGNNNKKSCSFEVGLDQDVNALALFGLDKAGEYYRRVEFLTTKQSFENRWRNQIQVLSFKYLKNKISNINSSRANYDLAFKVTFKELDKEGSRKGKTYFFEENLIVEKNLKVEDLYRVKTSTTTDFFRMVGVGSSNEFIEEAQGTLNVLNGIKKEYGEFSPEEEAELLYLNNLVDQVSKTKHIQLNIFDCEGLAKKQ